MKSPASSRTAALIIGLMTLAHAIVALDLVLHFFPATPEITALWSVSGWVKTLWLAIAILGAIAVVLLYRKPVFGFLVSAALTGALYLGAVGLWGKLTGTFWIVLLAAILSAYGAWKAMRLN